MAQDEPLGLRFGKDHGAAAIRSLVAVDFAAGNQWWSDARSRPWDVGVAGGGFERRDPAFAKVASWRVAFNCFVEIADEDNSAEIEAQVPNQEEQGNANGPLLGALVVHVNIDDCEVGARLVGRFAELASDHPAFNSPCRITK